MKNARAIYLQGYRALVDRYLERTATSSRPETLYDPSRYILAGGGKRIRPLLVMLACELNGGIARQALHAAAAMEILHNFTLVHDDIMDHAAARRGRPTVHTKWDANVAILTGDVLLGIAYRTLLRTKHTDLGIVATIFTEGVVDVCEGQAFDKEFETNRAVTVDDYLMMIGKKTGKLIAVSAELGAIIGGASSVGRKAMRQYGHLVGRAFQVQDDLLDIVADERTFGKTIGGDVIEGKKTILLLHALKHARGRDRTKLLRVFHHDSIQADEIPEIRRIYTATGAIAAAAERSAKDIAAAHRVLNSFPPSAARERMVWFTDELLARTF